MYAKSNKYIENGAKCGYYRPLEESDTWTISIIASVKDPAQVPFKIIYILLPKIRILFLTAVPPPQGKGHSSSPLFGQCLLWPNGRPSEQLSSSCWTFFQTKRVVNRLRLDFVTAADRHCRSREPEFHRLSLSTVI